jgi:hypothetical protein
MVLRGRQNGNHSISACNKPSRLPTSTACGQMQAQRLKSVVRAVLEDCDRTLHSPSGNSVADVPAQHESSSPNSSVCTVQNEAETTIHDLSPATWPHWHPRMTERFLVLKAKEPIVLESCWNVMAHGDAREGKWRENWPMEWVASTLTLPRNMVYPALLPLMRTPRLPVVDRTDTPADLNRLVRFDERRNLVSARVPSHFKRSLHNIGDYLSDFLPFYVFFSVIPRCLNFICRRFGTLCLFQLHRQEG